MKIGRTTFEEFRGLLPVDHTLWQGESLGLYGLVGSGRAELAKTLSGEHSHDAGAVLVRGKPARIGSVAESLERYRIGYVSENRKEEGLILGASVSSNLTITIWNRLASRLLRVLGPRRDFDRVAKMIRRLDIKTPGPLQVLNNLSGGNQQKASIGVGVGAKQYIHDLIWKMAMEEGRSIIPISSDLPELVQLACRILIFKYYRIVGELADLNRQESILEQTSLRIGQYLA